MKPIDRQYWILNYLRDRSQPGYPAEQVDVLNRDFVEAFVRSTGAPCHVQMLGAPTCPALSRDLSALYKAGKLKRHATGLEGMAGMGFPRWVYSYSL